MAEWTHEHTLKASQMADDGHSWAEVAAAFGMSLKDLYREVRKHGITAPERQQAACAYEEHTPLEIAKEMLAKEIALGKAEIASGIYPPYKDKRT